VPPLHHARQVLKQVHPDTEIKSKAMKRIQKILTWIAFKTLKSLDPASRMQDLSHVSGSDSDISEALSAFGCVLAQVLAGELYKHAISEAHKATKKMRDRWQVDGSGFSQYSILIPKFRDYRSSI